MLERALSKPAHQYDKQDGELKLDEANRIKKLFEKDKMEHLKIDLDC